jgi:hypothetical protein
VFSFFVDEQANVQSVDITDILLFSATKQHSKRKDQPTKFSKQSSLTW